MCLSMVWNASQIQFYDILMGHAHVGLLVSNRKPMTIVNGQKDLPNFASFNKKKTFILIPSLRCAPNNTPHLGKRRQEGG